MRNVFWCGAGAMLTAAVAVYLAATYAASTDNGKLQAYAHGVRRALTPSRSVVVLRERTPTEEETPAPQVVVEHMPIDRNLIEVPEFTISGSYEIASNSDAEPCDGGYEWKPCAQTGCIPVDFIDTPDVMPYVDDEDADESPETMPHVGDDAEDEADAPMFIERIIWRLIDSTEKKFSGGEEASETPEDECLPYDECEGECTPCWPSEDQDGVACPCEEQEEGVDAIEEEEEALEDETEEEEAAEIDPHHCPDCRPRMIVCPYSGKCYPAAPETSKPANDPDSMEFRPSDANPESFPQ